MGLKAMIHVTSLPLSEGNFHFSTDLIWYFYHLNQKFSADLCLKYSGAFVN